MGKVYYYKDIYDRLSNTLGGVIPKGYSTTKKHKRKSRILQGLAGWYLNSEEYKNL